MIYDLQYLINMRTHNETLVKDILKAYSEGRKSFDGFALTDQGAGTETHGLL